MKKSVVAHPVTIWTEPLDLRYPDSMREQHVNLIANGPVPFMESFTLSWEELDFHDCDPHDGFYLKKWLVQWWVVRGMNDEPIGDFAVTHCPFCGMKLP